MITGKPRYIPEALVGHTLGKYHVKEIIGRGGMGVVFKVWDALEDRPKAIKMIPPELASSPLAFEDLKREISLTSSIIHPNIVKVLSLEAQDGQYFIVMEFIDGESLEMKMAWAKERRLKEIDVIRIMRKAAEGIAEAHARMVIHRDLKPRNIMESRDGDVKVLDFGISHRMGRSLTELTGVQNTGTWPYMAPEQLSNNFGKEDHQVDIWAMGVTMYQLLTGDIPFRHREQIIDVNEKPFPLENVSKKTALVVMKCMEKDRKKRYQYMTELLKDLEIIEKSTEKKEKHLAITVEEKIADQEKEGTGFFEWPRVVAALVLILAVFFLYYSLKSNSSFRYNLDLTTPPVIPMTEARQEYEANIKEAEAAANRGDFTTAFASLTKAREIAATARTARLSGDFIARNQGQIIKIDFQELTAFLNSPAAQSEKIEKSRLFLEKYKSFTISNNPMDTEALGMISQIQDSLAQMQVKTILPSEADNETMTGYYNKLRRIEVPGLAEGTRVLGSIQMQLQVTAKGVISVQSLDIGALKLYGTANVETIKQMIIKKIITISLSAPRDKNNAPAKIKDWDVIFKIGTFQNKIILRNEGKI
jgi:serine/threonine protein kinase